MPFRCRLKSGVLCGGSQPGAPGNVQHSQNVATVARWSVDRATAERLPKGQLRTPTLVAPNRFWIYVSPSIATSRWLCSLAWRLNREVGYALSWFGRGVFRHPKKGRDRTLVVQSR